MDELGLTELGRYWVAASEKLYDIKCISEPIRISHDDPISGCHIFQMICEQGQFALKVYPRGWWPDRLFRAHLAAEFLNKHGFPAPRPLRTSVGDRVLFLGENAAICGEFLPGQCLWESQTKEWLTEEKDTSRLCVIAKQIARLHRLLLDLPAEPTRIRLLPSAEWLRNFVEEVGKQSLGNEVESSVLDTIRSALKSDLFTDVSATGQHILVDCHPGQFLFDNDSFTGIVDFDHVATGLPVRDLCKFLSTDDLTLSCIAEFMNAYIEEGSLPGEQKEFLPAGIIRYIIVSTLQQIERALTNNQPVDLACESFHRRLRLLSNALPDLKEALCISQFAGMPQTW